MATRKPPTYQGKDEAVRRWSEAISGYLVSTFSDLYKIVERDPLIKYATITATGTTLIGGLTFEPSMVILVAEDATLDSFSIGMDDGSDHHCIATYPNGSNITQTTHSSSYSIYLRDIGETAVLQSYVSAKNSTSLTITSAVTGTISAEVKLLIFP